MRTTSKLTVRGVETAKPGLHRDGGGLYRLVTETGRRRGTYIFRRGTERTELGLGVYPDVLRIPTIPAVYSDLKPAIIPR